MSDVVKLSDRKKQRAAKRTSVRAAGKFGASYTRWLWFPRVPIGKLSLIAGLPDDGKSLIGIDLAARVSSGRPMPLAAIGKLPQCGVWIHSSEDDPGDTIAPRLEAAGADLDRVMLTTDGDISLPEDLDAVEELVITYELRLIVIDPIESIISPELDAHSSKDVRTALNPLVALATRHGVAVVGIRHFNKDIRTTNAKVRGTGSLAYTALARSELMVGRHPDDEVVRVMAGIKNNIAPRFGAITFEIEPVATSVVLLNDEFAAFNPPGQPGDKVLFPRIKWGGVSEVKASDILRGQASEGKLEGRASKSRDAERLILAALGERDGSRVAGEVIELGEDIGISDRTMKQAAANLVQQGKMQRDKTVAEPGKGGGGEWIWKLIVEEGV